MAGAVAGCSRVTESASEKQPQSPAAAVAAAPAANKGALSFIEDDYERARSEATRRKVPLFVDVWASWCHTCLSIKQYVLPDPALAPLANAYVWLAIDSEKPSNAPFLRKFVSRSLPTLWVIEPSNETPTLKWIGAATATELHDVLADVLQDRASASQASAARPDRAGAAHASGALPDRAGAAKASAALPDRAGLAQPSAALQSPKEESERGGEAPREQANAPRASGAGIAEANADWYRGLRASAAGDAAQAIEHFRRALAAAPQDWARRSRTLEALSMRLAETDRSVEVVELATREAAAMPAGTARLNVVLNAIDSAGELAADAPERKALPDLIQLGTRIADESGNAVLLDDRSSLYLSLVSVLKTSDPAAAENLATRWSGLLDAQAARETDPARRRVWDPHRVEAYLAIGEPARAIPMLEQSEREQPSDYNPPARLARVYLTLGRVPEARAAIDRAIPRSEGPRRLRLYMLKSEVLVAADDKQGAKAALEEALQFAKQSQLPPQYDKLRQSIERRVQELG